MDNCHVVSLEWLLESIKVKKPISEKPYILGSAQNGTVPDGTAQNGNGAKAQPETTGKKRAIKKEDEDEGDTHKKQKDSQKASFKNLNVPVDEEYLLEPQCFVGRLNTRTWL